jgi:DNA-binding MarR family transcriptional regulator
MKDLPNDLINLTEARRLLGVSRIKMGELVKKGYVRSYPSLLDLRVKLVSKAEVLALRPNRAEAA